VLETKNECVDSRTTFHRTFGRKTKKKKNTHAKTNMQKFQKKNTSPIVGVSNELGFAKRIRCDLRVFLTFFCVLPICFAGTITNRSFFDLESRISNKPSAILFLIFTSFESNSERMGCGASKPAGEPDAAPTVVTHSVVPQPASVKPVAVSDASVRAASAASPPSPIAPRTLSPQKQPLQVTLPTVSPLTPIVKPLSAEELDSERRGTELLIKALTAQQQSQVWGDTDEPATDFERYLIAI
jgi:hypothetical protein